MEEDRTEDWSDTQGLIIPNERFHRGNEKSQVVQFHGSQSGSLFSFFLSFLKLLFLFISNVRAVLFNHQLYDYQRQQRDLFHTCSNFIYPFRILSCLPATRLDNLKEYI